MSIATRLREARQKKGITGWDLDKAAGLALGHSMQIESGKVPKPRADTLYRIAQALAVPMEFFLQDEAPIQKTGTDS